MRTQREQEYQPRTGQKCVCRRGAQRDNCATCEGTGWVIDFANIRARTHPVKSLYSSGDGNEPQST